MSLTPSAMLALPPAELPALELLLLGGEACPAELVRLWAPGRQLWNAYGPTEATCDASAARCLPSDRNPPIGRPLANTQLYILDAYLQPVPIGVSGELHIGGVGLARGYLNRPELTAQKFIANPFSAEPGSRLYKTGDLARYQPDGNIEFLGRLDHQVKLRGFRIELGEIESVLSSHPDVAACAVIAREDSPGDKRLVAYVVAQKGRSLDAQTLRQHLLQKLPDYMLPAAWGFPEALPLTPNGKVDRKALPAPSTLNTTAAASYAAPEGDVEATLVAIWGKILGVERVGVHDNFFELGGHSLSILRVRSEIEQQLGRSLAVVELFQHPTVAALARFLVPTFVAPEKAGGLSPQERATQAHAHKKGQRHRALAARRRER